MKESSVNCKGFHELTTAEMNTIRGGSFAYDVGRLIRFVVICGPNNAGIGDAIGDAVFNHVMNTF